MNRRGFLVVAPAVAVSPMLPVPIRARPISVVIDARDADAAALNRIEHYVAMVNSGIMTRGEAGTKEGL